MANKRLNIDSYDACLRAISLFQMGRLDEVVVQPFSMITGSLLMRI